MCVILLLYSIILVLCSLFHSIFYVTHWVVSADRVLSFLLMQERTCSTRYIECHIGLSGHCCHKFAITLTKCCKFSSFNKVIDSNSSTANKVKFCIVEYLQLNSGYVYAGFVHALHTFENYDWNGAQTIERQFITCVQQNWDLFGQKDKIYTRYH